MIASKLFTRILAVSALIFLFGTPALAQDSAPSFIWPEGKKAALSLSFDDARLSNVDVGLSLFKKTDTKVTYYVIPSGMETRKEQWKQAVADGHEIANHTLFHPCSGNFAWARAKALENYNLAAMRAELVAANEAIEEMLGVTPKSFAYTCGQTYVGRGQHTASYVPLIAELFTSGRGWLDEASNDPLFADMAQLQGVEMDGKDFETQIKPLIDEAVQSGRWLVLAGHEIGESGRQTTRIAMLEKLIAYAQKPNSGIWLAPVGTIAEYVNEKRAAGQKTLKDALTLAATFDQGYDADLSLGNSQLYTAPAYNQLEEAKAGMHSTDVSIAEGEGLFGDALHFKSKGKPSIFYQSANNFTYSESDWSGSISLWLSVDPEKELAPGYTDPIQITDVGYNDAAFWVDFSNKNPRSFRMGVYGDLKVWNPDNIGPDEYPGFQKRLLPAKDRPFGSGVWTHVVVTFKGINTEKGSASFYINGKYQGSREITEPFTWDLAKSKIFLGLNYIGKIDEVSLYNQSLTAEEVNTLYQLPNGLSGLLKQ